MHHQQDSDRLSGAHFEVEFHRKQDGSLYRALPEVATELRQTIARFRPDFLLTHAFEHGHPDHDCCSFLAAHLGTEFRIRVWEMPIYGMLTTQKFEEADETIAQIAATDERVRTKGLERKRR